jgi:hypothetical protein
MNSHLPGLLDRGRCSRVGAFRAARFVFLFLIWSVGLCVPGICHANEPCPWLNEATAAGFLKAEVTSTVTHPNKEKDDADCEFIHRDGSIVTGLQIEVETVSDPNPLFTSYVARCGANPEPVKTIGNEAVVCSLDGKKGKFVETVVGRVRNRVFVVRISSSGDESARATARERGRKIAEQVAGILF